MTAAFDFVICWRLHVYKAPISVMIVMCKNLNFWGSTNVSVCVWLPWQWASSARRWRDALILGLFSISLTWSWMEKAENNQHNEFLIFLCLCSWNIWTEKKVWHLFSSGCAWRLTSYEFSSSGGDFWLAFFYMCPSFTKSRLFFFF